MLALLIGALAGTRAETIATTYVDLKGKIQNVTATTVTDNTTTLASGWYIVNTIVRNYNRIRVEDGAKVNLILSDWSSFLNPKGMTVSEGSSLTVWAQSKGNGTWTIKDPARESACIGGEDVYGKGNSGVITINGGEITAYKNLEFGYNSLGLLYPKGAAIGGAGQDGKSGSGSRATVIINGGTIKAWGSYNSAAIGGGPNSQATVTINGGNIEAIAELMGIRKGEQGYGIGGGFGDSTSVVTLNHDGGTVITADDYNGTVTLKQPFSNGSAIIPTGEVKDNSLLNQKTLKPVQAFAVWCAGNKTLYFDYGVAPDADGKYQGQNVTGVWTGQKVTNIGWGTPGWYVEQDNSVGKVVFTETFANVRPRSLNKWFASMVNLEAIEGIGYLNTSQTTNMSSTFADCQALTVVDVNTFDVSKVTNASSMFANCTNLKTIYCDKTWTISPSTSMFNKCLQLKGATDFAATNTNGEMANPATGYFTGKWAVNNAADFSHTTVSLSKSDAYTNDTVTFTATAADGQSIERIKVVGDNSGNYCDLTEQGGTYTFVMPAEPVTVAFDPRLTVPYRDLEGNIQIVDAMPITKNTSEMTTGWYVMTGELEKTGRINVAEGCHANLILADDSHLTSYGGFGVNANRSLTIWGQQEGTGFCDAVGKNYYDAAIGSDMGCNSGDIIINGGVINARGNAAIGAGEGGGGYVTINGGDVTATGDMGGAGIGAGCEGWGFVTINGGKVNATGSTIYDGSDDFDEGGGEFGAAGIGGGIAGYGEVTVNGGTVWAFGGLWAPGIGGGFKANAKVTINGGNLDLGWHGIGGGDDSQGSVINLGYTDSVRISAGYYNGEVRFNNNFTDGRNVYDSGTTNNGGLGGKTLVPYHIPFVAWCAGNKTLYFDTGKSPAVGDTYKGQTVTDVWTHRTVTDDRKYLSVDSAGWFRYHDNIQYVVFDKSFGNVRPLTCANWFNLCRNLKSFTGLENLNTSETSDMYSMFYRCESVEEIDARFLDVSKVTDMRYMFSMCPKLVTIYSDNNWKTGQETDSKKMFEFSSKLSGAINYDYKKVDIAYANPTSGYFTTTPTVVLHDLQDNSAVFAKYKGMKNINVSYDRILRATDNGDGTWKSRAYTTCLPYDLDLTAEVDSGRIRVCKLWFVTEPTEEELRQGQRYEFIFSNADPHLKAGYGYLIIVNEGELNLSANGVTLTTEEQEEDVLFWGKEHSDVWVDADRKGGWRGSLHDLDNDGCAEYLVHTLSNYGDFRRISNTTENERGAYLAAFRAAFFADFYDGNNRYYTVFKEYVQGDDDDPIVDFPAAFYDGDNDFQEVGVHFQTAEKDGIHRFYDLQGRPLKERPGKGIYIDNGKTVSSN